MVDYENRSYTTITDIRDKQKVKNILELIPDDVKSIIDIGCGNGLITNELGKIYNTLGVDINEDKLKFVETDKLKSSCTDIDRPDESFDLVFSSEMLEHLEEELFSQALEEFSRLSKKYVLITVPNKEPLHKLFVKCQHCGEIYHKNGHLRSFSEKNIGDLRPDWNVLKSYEFGRNVRDYHKSLANLKHKLTPSTAWIPNYWIKNQGVNYHFCTKCGEKNALTYRFHPIAFFIDTLNIVSTGKNKSHLLALFQKKNT